MYSSSFTTTNNKKMSNLLIYDFSASLMDSAKIQRL